MTISKSNISLKLIVTGTGRCGSVTFSKILTKAGIPCGHESIFSVDPFKKSHIENRLKGIDRTVSYICNHNFYTRETIEDLWIDPNKIVADSSYMAAPYLTYPDLKNTPVLHLVRNPFDVISSFVMDANYFSNSQPLNHFEDFIYGVLPVMRELKDNWTRACYFYYYWNKMIEQNVENQPYMLAKLEDGYTNEVKYFVKGNVVEGSVNIKSNSWKARKINIKFDELDYYCKDLIKKSCEKYNYLVV